MIFGIGAAIVSCITEECGTAGALKILEEDS